MSVIYCLGKIITLNKEGCTMIRTLESNIISTIHRHTINSSVVDKVRIIRDYIQLYGCVSNLRTSAILKGLCILDTRLNFKALKHQI